MIFVIPYLTSITALMVVVFAGALAAGYVSAGSERISYAGFQIAFAFFLCVIQGPSPAFDLSTARDRIIGILLGNVVAYLVFINVWPVSISKRIDPAIAALLRRLAALMTAAKTARPALAAQAQSELAEIETDIALAAYEPSTVRPDAQWLTARRKAADEIGALGSPLLLDAAKDATTSAQIARRLEALAGRFTVAEPQPLPQGPIEWSASPLFPMIDTGLRRLEETSI
jgi:multidrug resistance protein MdtO